MIYKPLRVLIVEDSEDDAELLLRQLRHGGYFPTFERVDTPEAMRAALDRQPWDLVIADYVMPRFSGPDALALVQERGLDLPFIIVSGKIGESAAAAAMKAGAHDFFLKWNLTRLVPAIQRELREAHERAARRKAEQALLQSAKRFRSLIENALDIIALLDPDGMIRYQSPSVERLLGYGGEHLVGTSILEHIHPDDRQSVAEFLTRVLRLPRIPVATEFRFQHRDGSWRVLEAIANNLLDDPGAVGIVVNARDVTERSQDAALIQRQVQRLAALRTIDTAIRGSLDLSVMLGVLLDQVTEHLHVDAAAVLLMNRHTQMLEYAAGRGFRTKAISRSRVRLGEGEAGRVALERTVRCVRDLADPAEEFTRRALLADEQLVTYCAAPLVAKGRVRGVLETFRRTPHDPDPDWTEFLETLTGQAAIAIDNAQLFHELHRTNEQLALAYDTTLEGWSSALDLRDNETEGHSQRVTEVTVHVARVMGMTDDELVQVRRGALLHDIGKMGVPDSILLKHGPLNAAEEEIMRRHPVHAHELLSPIAFLRPALDIPYYHHEKWDGTGYPQGLKGDQIPLAARIFAVVDVWDALRSERPYRAAWSAQKVREHIRSLAGTHFDPEIVRVFLEMEAEWDPFPSTPRGSAARSEAVGAARLPGLAVEPQAESSYGEESGRLYRASGQAPLDQPGGTVVSR